MWLRIKILWWVYHASPNVFVSKIQKMYNETLKDTYMFLFRVSLSDEFLEFRWQTRMKITWMLGAVERELVVRGFTL